MPVAQPVAAAPVAATAAADAGGERDDAGTVVGAMQSSNAVHNEQAVSVGGVKAMPAVRALAKKLGVDLARVRASGADGTVSLADVKHAATDTAAPGEVALAVRRLVAFDHASRECWLIAPEAVVSPGRSRAAQAQQDPNQGQA